MIKTYKQKSLHRKDDFLCASLALLKTPSTRKNFPMRVMLPYKDNFLFTLPLTLSLSLLWCVKPCRTDVKSIFNRSLKLIFLRALLKENKQLIKVSKYSERRRATAGDGN